MTTSLFRGRGFIWSASRKATASAVGIVKYSLFSSCCLCCTLRLSAFTSTFAIDRQKAEALDAGFDYCLTKPIDEDQLMALINLCWEKAEQIDFADDSTGSPQMESTIYRSSLACQKIESALPQIR